MTDVAISVRNVSKCYRLFDDQRSRLLHAIWPKHTRGMREVWALKDISFEIKRGEAVALIGRNGGGKSTLLEILTGTLTSTTGEVNVNGRVSALLELGSGFNPEYSGRDNVMLNGLLLGLSREDILGRFGEIEAFAEIGAAIDRPVKTYSSGMVMRLAFAVQVLCDPEILIIDEALSVGDFFFQQKCLSFIRGLCAKGVTLLFVSHDMGTVRDICKRAIYLRGGDVVMDGKASEVIYQYLGDKKTGDSPSSDPADGMQKGIVHTNTDAYRALLDKALWRNEEQVPAKEGMLLAVAVCDENGVPGSAFKVGDTVVVSIVYVSNLLRDCHAGISIINKFGQTVTVMGSYFLSSIMPEVAGAGNVSKIIVCEIKLTLMIEVGNYSLEVQTAHAGVVNQGVLLDQTPALGPISVQWDFDTDKAPFLGQVGLPASCTRYFVDREIRNG